MVENNLGSQLREKRIRDNLTQKELGNMLKISNDYISKIEKGKQDFDKISDRVMEAIEGYLSGKTAGQSKESSLSLDNFQVSAIHEGLTPEEAELVRYYREMSDYDRKAIMHSASCFSGLHRQLKLSERQNIGLQESIYSTKKDAVGE